MTDPSSSSAASRQNRPGARPPRGAAGPVPRPIPAGLVSRPSLAAPRGAARLAARRGTARLAAPRGAARLAARRIARLAAPLLAGSLLLTLTGCQDAASPPAALPPPAVVAVPARAGVIEEQGQLVGRVAAVDRVELRARVEGFLKERRFAEGQPVAAGDLLFLIEPEPYEAIVAQREADVARARADATNADAQLKRGQELIAQKNIAQARVDELQAAALVAQAGVAQAEAALTAARLDLSYTRIQAPIAGRIGLASQSVGNLVSPASGVLATIVSGDPIQVQFPVTQRDLLAARRDVQARGGDAERIEIRLRLPDGSLYEEVGHLDFVDVTASQGTDSVLLRAAIANPKRILVDGQYVGVLLQRGDPKPALLIPQAATQIDQQGVFVLIVDADNKAQVRRIETGVMKGSEIAVTAGLQAGELVIAEGIQKVRPGQTVRAAPAQPPVPAARSAAP